MRMHLYAFALLPMLLAGQAANAQQADQLVPTVAPTPAPEVLESQPIYQNATLQMLNKVTTRISKLPVAVTKAAHFGTLEISLERCWKAPATEQPENAALLTVIERKPDEAPKMIFHGWMFGSSPSLSGLEHPVYDLIVVSCDGKPAENKAQ